MGILISSDPSGHSKSMWKFHGGGNFDIILSLWTMQITVKFHGGGNFDFIFLILVDIPSQCGGGNFEIILSLWTFQVNVKVHGGGNFDIILSLWTFQVNVGVGILRSSYPCGQSKSM